MEELVKKTAEGLQGANYVIALTGAGISTESGIPDYRGPNGVWTRDPEAEKRAYRSFSLYQDNPRQYWEERMNNPGPLGDVNQYEPNDGHYALVELEKINILRCVITQNIDNLHVKAGTQNIIEYHGNALKLRCPACHTRYRQEDFDLQKLQQEKNLPPLCHRCQEPIKSDVVHFGEPIPEDVMRLSLKEAGKCDFMLICGTSAAVYPFASLPMEARRRTGVAIVEINAAPTPLTEEGISDYLLEGSTGDLLPRIVKELKAIQG